MQRGVEIVGTGRTCSEEKWTRGLVDLAVEAGGSALDDCAGDPPSAIVVGNAYGGALGDQRNLGAYVAARLGMGHVEALSVACDEASGGAAVRAALCMIEAGLHDTVLVVGAEKTSDTLPDRLEAVRAAGLDAVREAGFGFGPAVASGLGMARYVEQHGIDRDLFYYLAKTAHHHGARNPKAFFPWELPSAQYLGSPVVASPMTVCDLAPPCDGAAAVVLRRAASRPGETVRILGSSSACAATGISSPVESLTLPAAQRSAALAMAQAGVSVGELSFAELHDSSSFLAVLSIEAVGLADRGHALARAQAGDFLLGGAIPLWTFGGLKARGNAAGAAGVYQVVEAALQLKGAAGDNQVAGARLALVQCLGSFGAMAVTHVLG